MICAKDSASVTTSGKDPRDLAPKECARSDGSGNRTWVTHDPIFCLCTCPYQQAGSRHGPPSSGSHWLMSDKKPPPLIPDRNHKRCPVCGEISYSRAGVHPQCSAKKADAKQKERIKEAKLAEEQAEKAAPTSDRAPWQKSCPKCKALHHVRKQVCSCGQSLVGGGRPPTS